MTLANYLTIFRICISPIFLFIYLEYQHNYFNSIVLPIILLCMIACAELTDIFDGYLARKLNAVTDLGKILDPMADTIYHTSVFLTFTLPPIRLPLIFIFILLYRELAISTLRTICALKGYALAARSSGKIKAIMQAISAFVIIALLIPFSRGEITETTLQNTCMIIMTITAAYTLLSGFDYMYANRGYIAQLIFTQKNNTII